MTGSSRLGMATLVCFLAGGLLILPHALSGDALSRGQGVTGFVALHHQCRKWRMPVKTMAMPCSLAAAMTS
jgi:hypothetical protein